MEDQSLTRTISEDLNGLIRLLQGENTETMIHHNEVPVDRKAWNEAWEYVNKNRYLLERRRQRALMTNESVANRRGAGITVGSEDETFFVKKGITMQNDRQWCVGWLFSV